MCCCCCPDAITALFCLWCQSGCRKGTVAGALTFFPPEPPLYQFQRRAAGTGRVLGDDEEATSAPPAPPTAAAAAANGDDATEAAATANGDASDDNEDKKSSSSGNGLTQRTKKLFRWKKSLTAETNNGDTTSSNNASDSNLDDELGEIEAPPGYSGSAAQAEALAKTDGQTQEKMRSPIQQLTDQVLERKKRAASRNARDARDEKFDVQYKLLLDPRLHVPPFDDASIDAVKIPSRRGVYVAAVVYRVPIERRTPTTKTIIYSHGNATDIGAMFPIQVILAHALDCNVLVYDYSGYGESGGVPEDGNTYHDLDAVFDYTLDCVAEGGDASTIILYGQSVGSGPCCYLAAKNHDIGGMILHSPFTSGMRVLTPSRLLACLDIYPNIDRIKRVQCPVFIMHGRLDQEVDISHGVELQRAVPREYRRDPWWVPDRGHNDITDGTGKLAEYVRRIRHFLHSL